MSAASFDGARNPGVMRGYVRLADGRRPSYMHQHSRLHPLR
jgi:hypothetical protein